MSIAFLTAVATFVAGCLVAVWLARAAGGRGMDVRIRALAATGHALPAGDAPFARRVLAPVVESFGAGLAGLLPGRLVRGIERRLIAAGQPAPPAVFLTLSAASGALLAGTYLALVLVATSGAVSPVALLPAVLLGAIGVYLPVFRLSSQVRARRSAILKDLPDSLACSRSASRPASAWTRRSSR
jgi:pilus assembly protein TadC